ncbi:MAG: hypothetical protein M5U12_20045 [Verrucomicrobia bacterium]|nr:hypothetical protein [Verrucomicrobiota bacterium]
MNSCSGAAAIPASASTPSPAALARNRARPSPPQLRVLRRLRLVRLLGRRRGRRPSADSNRRRTNLSGLPDAVRITIAFAPTAPRGPPAVPPADTGTTAEEPPLVFQTVVRLAVTATRSSSSGTTLRTEPIPGASPTPGAPVNPTR